MIPRLIFALCAASLLFAQPERPIRVRPEKKQPAQQVLEVPQDPPAAIAAETGRLAFYVSPLSAKGLLSQQIRDALKAIDKASGNATLVKIRAFVAGTGDMRRVQAIVSEDFGDKKRPLPAISTIQVGALPLEGAQVVIEAVVLDKKIVNPNGLAFFPAASVRELQSAAEGKIESMLRVTCLMTSLEQVGALRTQVNAAFPGAAADFVQATRLGVEPVLACEGVGRAAAGAEKTPKLIFTGIQMAFHPEDADIRLAFDRLKKSIEAVGGRDVVFLSSYPLNRAVDQRAAAIRSELFRVPGTSLQVEGLPSLDATLAIEAIAAAR